MSNIRVIISYFIRRLVLATEITETAAKFVKQYLKPYLRDEILEDYTYQGFGKKKEKGSKKGLEINPLLAGALAKAVGEPERKQKLFEDIAFEFTKPMKDRDYFVGRTGEDIRTELEKIANEKLDMSPTDAHKIIARGGGAWDEDDTANFEDLREDFLKAISKYIRNFFFNTFVHMLESKETRTKTDLPEADKETAEFIKDFEDFSEENGSEYEKEQSKAVKTLGFSVKDLREFIKESPSLGTWSTPTKKDRDLFITILDSNVLKKKGETGYKTYDEIAEEFDLKRKTNIKYQSDVLKKIVKNLMTQKKHEKGEIEKKGADMEAVLPYSIITAAPKVEYKIRKKEPENPAMKEKLEKALGDKKEETQKKVEERKESPDFKRVVYKKTQEGDLERLKEELAAEEAKKGQERIPKKIERLKKEVAEFELKSEDAPVAGSIATKSHVTIIDNAIKRNKIRAIIEFSANYDNLTILKKDGPDPEKDPVDFKYEKYTASFKGARKGKSKKGTWRKTVDYTYRQNLTDEGDFTGSPKSDLLLDGKTASANDNLKKDLDDYVEKHMKPEGMLPYGRSVVKEKGMESVKFPTIYENTKLDETYFGAHAFFTRYQGLLTEDISQQKRRELVEQSHKQVGIGRSTETEIMTTIKQLETELKKSPEDKSDIEGKIKKLRDSLKKVTEFPVKEESAKGLADSRKFLLDKNKAKLEKVTEEFRTENTLPDDEKDQDKIRQLRRRMKSLTNYIKELEGALKEVKKSSLISIASMLRNIHAVAEEIKDTAKTMKEAEGELMSLRALLRRSEEAPIDLEKVIELRKKNLDKMEGGPDKDRIQKQLRQLETLQDKLKKGPTDKLEEKVSQKEMLKNMIKEKEKEIEDIKNQQEKAKGKPGAFPKTESPGIEELYGVFSDAGVERLPKMTLYGWLSPVDFKQVAKQLQAVLRTKYEDKIKDMKAQKGKSDEERENSIRKFQKAHEEELGKVRKLIGDLPADLKKRRDQFKKDHPADFGRLKEPEWVDDEGKVKGVLKSIDQELSQVKEAPKSNKQQTVNILEKNKFYSLGDFLQVGKNGLGVLAKRLKKAPLEQETLPADLEKAITALTEKSTKNHAEAMRIYNSVNRALRGNMDPQSLKKIEDAKGDLIKAGSALAGLGSKANYWKSLAKEVPALAAVQALKGNLDYVSSLFNYYSSILWFGEKGALPTVTKTAEKEFTKDDIAEMTEIKDDVVEAVISVATTPLTNKEEVKRDISKAKKLINLFIDGYSDYPVPKKTPRQPAPVRPPLPSKEELEESKEEIKQKGGEPLKKATVPYDVIVSKKKEKKEAPAKQMSKKVVERMKEEAVFPADMMKEINTLLESLKREGKGADEAKEELQEVKEDVKKRHKGNLSRDELGKLFGEIKMEQGDMSDKDFENFKQRFKGEALAITGRVIDRVNRRVLNDYITKWENVLRGEKTQKKTPYINRKDPKQYEDMWSWVNQQLPGLSTEAPVAEREGIGKPTEETVRKFYEDAFKKSDLPVSQATLNQMKSIFKKEFELPEGGGGGKSPKTRPKAIKNTPPKGTFEVQKEWLVRKINKERNGHEVIMSVLDDYVLKLKKYRKKGDDFFVGFIVDGMVALLKEVLNKMKFITVDPPEAQVKLPIKGAPQFSGRADITIQNDKDAEAIYDKLRQMIMTINDFTDPDKVPTPARKMSQSTRADREFFPSGLMKWERGYRENKKEEKKSSAEALAFQLAQKFAYAENYSVDSLTEKDVIGI